jgi:hypothetical protein
MVEALPGHIELLGKRKIDCLATGLDSSAVSARQGLEQAIDYRDTLGRWQSGLLAAGEFDPPSPGELGRNSDARCWRRNLGSTCRNLRNGTE